jgi:WD40 repeat protein
VRHNPHFLAVALLVICLTAAVTGCSPDQPPAPTVEPPSPAPSLTLTPSPSPTQTITPSVTPSLPPTLTLTPSLTPTPTLTPIPWSANLLAADTAKAVKQLAQWGRGVITAQLQLEGGQKVLVTTGLGLYLYEVKDFRLVRFLPDARYIAHTPDQHWLAYSLVKSRQIGILEISSGRLVTALDIPVEIPKVLPDYLEKQRAKYPDIDSLYAERLFQMTGVAFNPEGNRLAVAFQSGDIAIWRLPEGALEKKLTRDRTSWTDETPTDQLAFSPDGSQLLTHEQAGHFVLWQINEGKLLWYLRYQNQNLSPCPFTPDGKRFITASSTFGATTANFYLRETRFGETLLTSPGTLSSSAVSKDGTLLAAAHLQTVKLFTLGDYPAPLRILVTGVNVYKTAFSNDAQQLIVNDGQQVWDLKEFKQVSSGPAPAPTVSPIDDARALQLGHLYAMDGLALGAQQQLYVWGHRAAQAYVWEAASGAVRQAEFSSPAIMRNLAFNPPGLLAACTQNGLELIQLADNQRTVFNRCVDLGTLAIAPDGASLARGAMANIDLVNRADGQVKGQLIEQQSLISRLSFSKDGQWLLANTPKNNAWGTSQFNLWQVNPPLSLHFSGFSVPGEITAMAVTPDGQWLALSSDKLRLWRIANREQVKIAGGTGITSLNFSPDSKLLAAGNQNGSITLWSVPEMELVAALQGHVLPVIAVAFTSDGKNLVSASNDGTVRLWGGANP